MNFFTLGYAFLVIHLNMGWASNYILKLAGILFMLGGISEISYFSKMFAGLKNRAYISLAVSASSCLIVSCFKLTELGGVLFSAVSVIAGTASVLAAFIFLRDLMNLLVQNNFLVNDASNISRLYSGWQKACFFYCRQYIVRYSEQNRSCYSNSRFCRSNDDGYKNSSVRICHIYCMDVQ